MIIISQSNVDQRSKQQYMTGKTYTISCRVNNITIAQKSSRYSM